MVVYELFLKNFIWKTYTNFDETIVFCNSVKFDDVFVWWIVFEIISLKKKEEYGLRMDDMITNEVWKLKI